MFWIQVLESEFGFKYLKTKYSCTDEVQKVISVCTRLYLLKYASTNIWFSIHGLKMGKYEYIHSLNTQLVYTVYNRY